MCVIPWIRRTAVTVSACCHLKPPTVPQVHAALNSEDLEDVSYPAMSPHHYHESLLICAVISRQKLSSTHDMYAACDMHK